MQDVPQRKKLGTGHGASDVRHTEQRGSKSALQSHAEKAPPAAQPALGNTATSLGPRYALAGRSSSG